MEDIVAVEVKAVQEVLPIHLAQRLSYLKLGGLRHGIKRMVN